MSDLKRYTKKRKATDRRYAANYDLGYQEFKIGVMIKAAREKAGLTQEELAKKMDTKKPAISRIENHAEDIKLSTLEKTATALGKKLKVSFA